MNRFTVKIILTNGHTVSFTGESIHSTADEYVQSFIPSNTSDFTDNTWIVLDNSAEVSKVRYRDISSISVRKVG